ncbi:Peptidase S53 domain-containing protein [Mycena chlorophos]|uniref:Peptidase S53 domain-containing protein n=1 Tax=Mycena chlorophos TaxID=658473 RepID=A0A8H6S2Y0_MYCCL|nr:Peptidase S53 domain-containing protein [Mycena chlorophos]
MSSHSSHHAPPASWPAADPGNAIFKFSKKSTTQVVDSSGRSVATIVTTGPGSKKESIVYGAADGEIIAVVEWTQPHPKLRLRGQDDAQEIKDVFPFNSRTNSRRMSHEGKTYVWKLSTDRLSYDLFLSSAPNQPERLAYWYTNQGAVYIEVQNSMCEPGLLDMIFLIVLLMSSGVELEVHTKPNGFLKFAIALEAAVRQLTAVSERWSRQDLDPSQRSNILLPQPITWLHLVDGRWVFVAYSNDEISRIACWDLLATQTEAIAEGFLSGRVESARVETQDNGIVLALALGGHQSGVLVTTLREKGKKYVFHELARVEQSSHVLMLSGTILGCAVLNDANVPHLVDWENNTVYEIPAPPGALDTPERRSVPHLIAIQNDILVVVRHTGVEVYQSHPSFQQPMSFLRLIPVSSIWEAVVVPTPTTRLHLLLLTSRGIESVTVDEHDSHEISCIARSPKCSCFIEDPPPSYL